MLVVIGATGFIGRIVLRSAQDEGIPVRAVSRQRVFPQTGKDIDWVSSDLGSGRAVARVIEEGDIVVNLAFARSDLANEGLVDDILWACKERHASRYIQLSTAVVVGRTRDALITETTKCIPGNAYERIKLCLEEKALAGNSEQMSTIVLRPTMVVGSGGANLQSLAYSLLNRSSFWNDARAFLFANRPMHIVPAKLVADSILHFAAPCTSSERGIFNVATDEDPDNRFRAVEGLLLDALCLQRRSYEVAAAPRGLLSLALRIRGRSDPALDRFYSADKLRSTGFTASISVAEAIGEFGRWFCAENLGRG